MTVEVAVVVLLRGGEVEIDFDEHDLMMPVVELMRRRATRICCRYDVLQIHLIVWDLDCCGLCARIFGD